MSVVAGSPWACIPLTKLTGPGLERVGSGICPWFVVFYKSPIVKNRYGDQVPVWNSGCHHLLATLGLWTSVFICEVEE